jgi:hypothetical protein
MSAHPGRGHERDLAQPFHARHPSGHRSADAEEGSPILEPALIADKVRPVFLSHEGDPISIAQRIHKAGFFRAPAYAFILCD